MLESVPAGLSKKKTDIVIRELANIEKENGLILAKDVVKRATPKNSPLHEFFEWDNGVAGDKYREVQARLLICQVYVRHGNIEESEKVRAFVNIKSQEEESDDSYRGYVSMETVLHTPSYQEQVLAYAKNQLIQWRLRFGRYQQFFGVVEEIDKIIPPPKGKKGKKAA